MMAECQARECIVLDDHSVAMPILGYLLLGEKERHLYLV